MARINPNNPKQISRLRESMSIAMKQLKPFRTKYIEMVRQSVGLHYGSNGADDRVPFNQLRIARDVYKRRLTARPPKTLVRSTNDSMNAGRYELELALNHVLSKLKLSNVLQECVDSALFVMGIAKVGLTATSNANMENHAYDAGTPFCSAVLFDNWLHDPRATRIDDMNWCGDRYRVDLERVQENPYFNKEVRQSLTATQGQGTNVNESGEDRTRTMSQGDGMIQDEYKDHVELWDIWLPDDGLVITLPADSGDVPLNVVEWEGAERGPYHFLNFSSVLGNVIGSAPLTQIYDLHLSLNQVESKISRQAMRQKTVGYATGAAAADGTAQSVMDAEDGTVVSCNDPNAIKEMSLGGIKQENLVYVQQTRELLNIIGGNLNSIGGLQQAAGTASQEKLLKDSSSELIQDMQDKTYEFTQGIITDLGMYLYKHPFLELPLIKEIPGTTITVPFKWGPESRQDSFFEYNISIEPYSMQPESPQDLMTKLEDVAMKIILPLMPMMQAQGLTFNFEHFLQLIARFGNLPELAGLISSGGIPMDVSNGINQAAMQSFKPAQTTRNYVRSNVPTGGTDASRTTTMLQSLGGSSQSNPDQMAALSR